MFWDFLNFESKRYDEFLFFPFRVIGACIVFTLAKGQKKFVVAYRFHAAKYYGLLLAGIVFLSWFFVRFIL